MSIYFGGTTDEELISELSHRGYAAVKNDTPEVATQKPPVNPEEVYSPHTEVLK